MLHPAIIIGSGLSAVAACRALMARGVRPLVLDVGKTGAEATRALTDRMRAQAPQDWTRADIDQLGGVEAVPPGRIPRKLIFGSDYFYEKQDTLPPHSHAKGGFSVGWGAVVLPPNPCDLADWPIQLAELAPYFTKILATIPHSAPQDRLSTVFPSYHEPDGCLDLSPRAARTLRRLDARGAFDAQRFVYGQSRLLINPNSGCRYCGMCMTGCVYDQIYKADRDIDQLHAAGKIIYRPSLRVLRVAETAAEVEVVAQDALGRETVFRTRRLFLAAGAVETPRILMQSLCVFDQDITIKTILGLVAPVLHRDHAPTLWPNAVSAPDLFLEIKERRLSDHWIHVQMSAANEFIMQKLGLSARGRGGLHAIRKHLAGHLSVAHVNLHSDHSNPYRIRLSHGTQGQQPVLSGARVKMTAAQAEALTVARQSLSAALGQIGAHVIRPLVMNSARAGGYQLGGGTPMRHRPTAPLDTNTIGNPAGWRRVHVVDSSTFPSLPATTIGLLAMANAWRIADTAVLD